MNNRFLLGETYVSNDKEIRIVELKMVPFDMYDDGDGVGYFFEEIATVEHSSVKTEHVIHTKNSEPDDDGYMVQVDDYIEVDGVKFSPQDIHIIKYKIDHAK